MFFFFLPRSLFTDTFVYRFSYRNLTDDRPTLSSFHYLVLPTWWSHQNVASVHDTSNRGEAGNLEKLLGKFLRLLRPADVVVTKIKNRFSNSAHHSSDSLRTWPVGVPNCVVEIVGTGETKKQEDLKNNLSS